MRKALVLILAALAAAPPASAGVRPVPSLTPAATHALWLREVARAKTRPRALADAGCRPARVVFYAQTDWLRLATKLAQQPSPCAQYYISIPPLAGDKTQARAGQAAQIRALGPSFHAVDEISYTAWAGWVAAGNGSFRDAGGLARQRMTAAGFDVSAGDTWALNELSSAVRAGTGTARASVLDLLQGLSADGVKGIAFGAGVSQSLTSVAPYKVAVQGWLQDTGFWTTLAGTVSDFAYESYGDVRDYAVAGSTPQQRRDATLQYLGHLETLANAAPPAAAAAQSFLRQAYVTFGNAAWSWPSAYGYTAVPLQTMEDYVAGQAYASRAFAAATGEAVDRLGYAWAPANVSTADSGALLDALAAAIRDSGTASDDPGSLACAGNRCATSIDGAAFTTAWQQFSSWSASAVAVTSAPLSLVAGTAAGPLTVQVQTAGVADTAKADLPVTFTSTSPAGGFAASASGPFTPSLTVTIPAGGTSASVYYTDTLAGTPTISATPAGGPAVTQQATVAAAPAAPIVVTPAAAKVRAGAKVQLAAAGRDAFGNAAPVAVTWTASAGAVSPGGLLTAPATAGTVIVTAAAGALTATATVAVTRPAPKVSSARASRVGGHVLARVVVRPAGRVRIAVRVRRGSSTVARLTTWTTRTGTFTWRSKRNLPPGRYVMSVVVRSASTA
jgi:hypothetical protein